MKNFFSLPTALLLPLKMVFALVVISVGGAHAATFTVTKFIDTDDGNCHVTDCSLREAVGAANANMESDTIVLGAGTYTLTRNGTDADTYGDLDITKMEVTVTGQGSEQTIINAEGISDRIFHVHSWSDLTVSGVSLENGSPASMGGGAILCEDGNLTVQTVDIRENVSSNNTGGAIYASGCAFSIKSSQVRNNTASQSGGGISIREGVFTMTKTSLTDNSASYGGGGLYVYLADSTDISYSTIRGNSSNAGGGAYFNGGNGTVLLRDSVVSGNTAAYGGGGLNISENLLWARLENSTISGNSTPSYGGALEIRSATTISNCTIVDNTAGEAGTGGAGGILAYDPGAIVNLQNTIVAGNADLNNGTYPDCRNWNAQVASQGYNLVQQPGNCTFAGTGDLIGKDPLLGPLQDNSGVTWSHALLPDSPALDAGNPSFAPPPAYDQRGAGYPRVSNNRIDIGAYEFKKTSILLLLPPMGRDKNS